MLETECLMYQCNSLILHERSMIRRRANRLDCLSSSIRLVSRCLVWATDPKVPRSRKSSRPCTVGLILKGTLSSGSFMSLDRRVALKTVSCRCLQRPPAQSSLFCS